MADFSLAQVPLVGRASISVGSETFVPAPDNASGLESGRRASTTVESTNQQLLLRVDRAPVQRVLRKKLGREPKAPIVFDPQMDRTIPGNRTVRGLLRLLVDAIDAATAPPSIALREFEGLLVGQLILGRPGNYHDELDRGPRPTVTRPITRAAD